MLSGMHWDEDVLSTSLSRTERWLVLGVIVAIFVGQSLMSFASVGHESEGQADPHSAHHDLKGAGHAPDHVGSGRTGPPASRARCATPSLDCGCDGCRSYFDAHFLALPGESELPIGRQPVTYRPAMPSELENGRYPPPYPPPR